jgi:hypothetical protein
MTAATWTPEYTARAERAWEEYQESHDLTTLHGQTAGVDPLSGRVWIGEDAEEILDRLESEGLDTPLYFVRIGHDYYFRKGRR